MGLVMKGRDLVLLPAVNTFNCKRRVSGVGSVVKWWDLVVLPAVNTFNCKGRASQE